MDAGAALIIACRRHLHVYPDGYALMIAHTSGGLRSASVSLDLPHPRDSS
jgi:hypothetical protein